MTKEYPWMLGPFEKAAEANPCLVPNAASRFFCPIQEKEIGWEAKDVFNPAAVVKDDRVYLLYRAEDHEGKYAGTSRVGMAVSEDGLHFQTMPEPVLYPEKDEFSIYEWEGGCEDPRIVETKDGKYFLYYTSFNGKVALLSCAESTDLVHWKKHGPIFKDTLNGKYKDLWSKSGAVVCRQEGDHFYPVKLKETYWMYWGEKFVNVATSTDLVNWEPMLDENGEFLKVMVPRAGKFDSDLTECGPPAILTDKGILLLYNGKNKSGAEGDTLYTANSYCAGQALFDAKDPTKLIDRLDKPFYIPESDFEKSGQYPAGTVFIEGLVFHNQKWFLYYGCADSRVAVAVYDPLKK